MAKKLIALRANEADIEKWRKWAESAGLDFSAWARARLNAIHAVGCKCEACRGTLQK